MAVMRNTLVCDGEKFEHFYLCHYRPVTKGGDELSRSLLRFKKHEPVDVDAWASCSGKAIAKCVPPRATILRALHSYEFEAGPSDKALDTLCTTVAREASASYAPHRLKKRSTHRSLRLLTKAERFAELSGQYLFAQDEPVDHILVVDDILTTGATLFAIIRAIRQNTFCPIRLFTLATTDHSARGNDALQLDTRPYAWMGGAGWLRVQEDAQEYVSLQNLVRLIQNDFEVP